MTFVMSRLSVRFWPVAPGRYNAYVLYRFFCVQIQAAKIFFIMRFSKINRFAFRKNKNRQALSHLPISGLSGETWTPGLLNPIQARYQLRHTQIFLTALIIILLFWVFVKNFFWLSKLFCSIVNDRCQTGNFFNAFNILFDLNCFLCYTVCVILNKF